MKIKFYLKRPKSKTETALYALVNYNNNSIKIYTGEAITPKHWNKKAQYARASEEFKEHPQFNQRLDNFKSSIKTIYLNYKNLNGGREPGAEQLKALIEPSSNENKVNDTFLKYFEDFVNRTFNRQRVAKKKNGITKIIGENVARGYQTTLIHLKRFNESWDRNLDFDSIDLKFYDDFTEFLTLTGTAIHPITKKARPLRLSANTVGSHFQRIKAVLTEATTSKVNKNTAFTNFIKQNEEADTIYLDDDELKEISELDFSNNSRLDNVRDLFLIGAYTGLRYSDFSILKPENISDNRIRITQTKTGKPVVIPLHKIVRKILEKRSGELPRSITNEKMNLYLKEIGKESPALNRIVPKSITKGGYRIIMNCEKWRLLTTHSARRSFATNWYKKGVPTVTLMGVTGHKTEKSFLAYIRVNPEEHANILQMYMDREENNSMAV